MNGPFAGRSAGPLALASAALAAIALASCGAGPEPGPQRERGPLADSAGPCPPARARFSARRPPPACWRPYGPSSPFNRPVPARPRLLSNSAEIVRRVTSWGGAQRLLAGHADTPRDYFHPLYWSSPGDPLFKIRCVRFGRCPVEGHRIRIPDAARAAGGGDAHLAVIDPRTGWEYDLWQVRAKPVGGGTIVASYGGRTRIDGSGLGSNATAAWFGLAAGVIRAAEMRAGTIDHALFAQVRCTSGRSVFPAQRGTSGAACSRFGLDTRHAPPLGARLWLDLRPQQIARLRIPAWRKTILRAMHRYGMIVGDSMGGNGSWGIQGESGSSFTSFGVADPWAAFAASVGGPSRSGVFSLDLDDGFPWARHLRVLHPCVSRGSC